MTIDYVKAEPFSYAADLLTRFGRREAHRMATRFASWYAKGTAPRLFWVDVARDIGAPCTHPECPDTQMIYGRCYRHEGAS